MKNLLLCFLFVCFTNALSAQCASPTITSQPANTSACASSNVIFTISATGTSLTYQWTCNGINVTNGSVYTGANTSTLTITGVTSSMNGNAYRCIVSGACSPTATSNIAYLSVNATPGISITSNPTICAGTTTASLPFTTTGSPNIYTINWNTSAMFAGFTNVTSTALPSSPLGIIVPGSVSAGTYSGTITVIVSGTGCVSAAVPFSVTVNSVVVPTITITSTASAAICPGTADTFYASITNGGTAPSYQWQKNGVAVGIASTYIDNSLNNGDAISCVLLSSATCAAPNPVTSNTIYANVNSSPAITSQPSNTTVCSGSNATFSLTATGTGLSYQWYAVSGSSYVPLSNGPVYSGVTTSTLTITSTTSSMNNNQYKCIVSGTCTPAVSSNIYTLFVNTPPSISGQPANLTICLGSNATFSVYIPGSGLSYQWQENTGSGFANISNNSTYSGATTDTLQISSPASTYSGYSYRCIVSGACSPSDTSSSALLTMSPATSISQQPLNDTVCNSTSAGFSVSAVGAGLSYHWQLDSAGSGFNYISNGGVYSGATTNSLSISATTSGMSGNLYRCIVSGSCGSSTSDSALLTVAAAPSIIVTGNVLSASSVFWAYQWYLNGSVIPGATSTSLTATQSGCYGLVVSPSATTSCSSVSYCDPFCSGDTAQFTYALSGLTSSFSSAQTSPAAWQILAYSWNFGDGSSDTVANPSHTYSSSGTYVVSLVTKWVDSASNTVQCSDTTTHTLVVGDVISGTISIDTSSPNPSNPICMTWLIVYDSATQILSAVDSTIDTGSNYMAYYQFINEPAGSYRVKAMVLNGPTSGIGPVPTYDYDSLHWSGANVITYSGLGADTNNNILIQQDSVTSGPGFIGGNVTMGANKGTKTTGPGAEGMIIFLRGANNHFIKHTYTDVNGNYSFSNLAIGNYIVYPEALNYNTVAYTSIQISSSNTNINSINFMQHTVSKTITPIFEGIKNILPAPVFKIFPNPSTGIVNIICQQASAQNLQAVVTDVVGHKVFETNVTSGNNQINLSNLESGIYFINIKAGNINYSSKIALQR